MLSIKCVFRFPIKFLPETFFFLRINERNTIKITLNYNGFEYAPWYKVFLEQWVFKELGACFITEAHHCTLP
jgi:hypothetical protein